ncbi:MAG TPA: hypothetical protein VEB18_01115 [Candidatus Paceibacterota bacterium]|nr:hypothetical protein [Candidatus Paceibacterota bacterium]
MAHDPGFRQFENKADRAATGFIREAHQRALYWRQHRAVNPEKFKSVPPEEAKRDADYAKRMDQRFAMQNNNEESTIAGVFEVGLWWLTRTKKLLGEQTSAVLPSRFDDIVNGVDLILEILKENEPVSQVGVGIDATFGYDKVHVKLADLGDKVAHGEGAKVKYYLSSDGEERALTGVPRVIIGLSVDHARELAQLWRRAESGEQLAITPDKHPLRVLILQQLVTQTGALAALARSQGNEVLADAYATAFKRLNPIYQTALAGMTEKSWKNPKDDTDYRQDPIHQAIVEKTKVWRSESGPQKQAA